MAEVDELVQNLWEHDEEELEAQLGMRVQSIEEGSTTDASLYSLESDIPVPRGPMGDKVLEIGQQLFNRVYAESYGLLCTPLGGDDDTEKQLDKALDESYTKAAGMLAPVLASSLGLAPAIATIIATLIIKKISKNLAGGICSTWEKSLQKGENS